MSLYDVAFTMVVEADSYEEALKQAHEVKPADTAYLSVAKRFDDEQTPALYVAIRQD